jgi:hypothetical protein
MKKWHYLLIIGVIFLIGIGIRLVDITDHPFEIHGTRQMRSALISRDLYEGDGDVFTTYGMIEPPIIESLSTAMYLLLGEEIVWIGRVFSILFWTLGAAALFDLSARISNKCRLDLLPVPYIFSDEQPHSNAGPNDDRRFDHLDLGPIPLAGGAIPKMGCDNWLDNRLHDPVKSICCPDIDRALCRLYSSD